MKYLGGKAKLGAEIAQVIRSKRGRFQSYLEPFCGSGWVTQHLYPGKTIASDICESLILLHQAIQKGWEPPDFISEEEYDNLHQEYLYGNAIALIGFAGFACSWGGKWFAGYARGDTHRNYCLEAKNSLLKRHRLMKHVIFRHANYKNLQPCNKIIYCDPPYAGTTGYGPEWNKIIFWQTMREWSQCNTVIISEYQAPNDFEIIAEFEHFSIQGKDSKPTIERLFQWKKKN